MSLRTTLRSLHGNKVGAAIEELHRAENELVGELLGISDRHVADHEIHHVARDIAGWSREHVRRLAEVGRAYDLELDPGPDDRRTVMTRVKQAGAQLTARFHEPAVLLLADLRHLHRVAAGVSLDWEVLAQAAQAVEDADLLALASDCHPQTLRQMRFANAKVKELSAQAIVTG
jgi:hypothetical protein